jgi:hypothetical protein
VVVIRLVGGNRLYCLGGGEVRLERGSSLLEIRGGAALDRYRSRRPSLNHVGPRIVRGGGAIRGSGDLVLRLDLEGLDRYDQLILRLGDLRHRGHHACSHSLHCLLDGRDNVGYRLCNGLINHCLHMGFDVRCDLTIGPSQALSGFLRSWPDRLVLYPSLDYCGVGGSSYWGIRVNWVPGGEKGESFNRAHFRQGVYPDSVPLS